MSQGRPNFVVLVIGALVLIPMVALFAVSFGNDPRAIPSMLEDQPAPAFDLVDLDGNAVTLADLRGKPAVLNFWSTWCGPCKLEHGLLIEAARRYPDVQFLGIVYADEESKVRRYLKKEGTAYPHLMDPDGRAAIDYGVAGVPESYFINPNGIIVHKQVGPVTVPLIQDLLGSLQDIEFDPDDPGVAPIAADFGQGLQGLPPGEPPPAHMVPILAQEIGGKIRCPSCQGLTVADSTANSSILMQRRIRELVAMGYPAEDINDYFVSKYGEFILFEPTREGLNWVVWLGPLIMFGGGLMLAVMVVRMGDVDGPKSEKTTITAKDGYESSLLAEVDDV